MLTNNEPTGAVEKLKTEIRRRFLENGWIVWGSMNVRLLPAGAADAFEELERQGLVTREGSYCCPSCERDRWSGSLEEFAQDKESLTMCDSCLYRSRVSADDLMWQWCVSPAWRTEMKAEKEAESNEADLAAERAVHQHLAAMQRDSLTREASAQIAALARDMPPGEALLVLLAPASEIAIAGGMPQLKFTDYASRVYRQFAAISGAPHVVDTK